MADFRQLRNLRYGDLNDLRENDDNVTGDRRRTSPLTALRMATEKAFQKSTLKSIDKFQGVIVGRRHITYATAAYPSTLISPTSAEDEDSTYGNWLYRIYIPELEPLPPPTGSGDPVLLGYQEIPVDSVAVPRSSPLGLGQVVQVRYDDPELLNNPKIVKVVTERRPEWGAPGPVVETPSTNPNPNPTRQRSRTSTTTVPPPAGAPSTAPAEPESTTAAGEPCDNPHNFPVPTDMPELTPPEAWHKRKIPKKKARTKKLVWDDMMPIVEAARPLLKWIAENEGDYNDVNRTWGGDSLRPKGAAAYLISGPLQGRALVTMTISEVESVMMGYNTSKSAFQSALNIGAAAAAWVPPGSNAKDVDMDTRSTPKSKLHGDWTYPSDLAHDHSATETNASHQTLEARDERRARMASGVVAQWIASGRLAQRWAAWKNNGFYTVGSYQFIPPTFQEALGYIQGLNKSTDLFDETGQDKLGTSLLFRKRRVCGAYLLGLHDNVGLAAVDLAREWASIGTPFARIKRKNIRHSFPLTDPNPLSDDTVLATVGQGWYPSDANSTGLTGHTPCHAVAKLREVRASILTNPEAVAALEASGFRTSDQFLNNVPYEEE
jgi:hypothetical protein